MKQFTETSSDPYDRHHYRVWLCDGSFKDVESYDACTTRLVFQQDTANNN